MSTRAAVILIGGRSTRMGADKSHVALLGRPLLHHVVERVAQVAQEIVVVGRREQALPSLPHAVRRVYDEVEDQGPVGGLAVGLSAIESNAAFVCGCDAPFISPPLIEALFARQSAAGSDAIAWTRQEGFVHPLCSVYPRSAGEAARQLLAADRRRPVFLEEDRANVYVEGEELLRLDPDGWSFVNLNDPARLETVRAQLEEGEITIEMFEMARRLAGRPELAQPPGTLRQILVRLAERFPALEGPIIEGGCLVSHWRASLDGARFLVDPDTPIPAGSRLLLLGAITGG